MLFLRKRQRDICIKSHKEVWSIAPILLNNSACFPFPAAAFRGRASRCGRPDQKAHASCQALQELCPPAKIPGTGQLYIPVLTDKIIVLHGRHFSYLLICHAIKQKTLLDEWYYPYRCAFWSGLLHQAVLRRNAAAGNGGRSWMQSKNQPDGYACVFRFWLSSGTGVWGIRNIPACPAFPHRERHLWEHHKVCLSISSYNAANSFLLRMGWMIASGFWLFPGWRVWGIRNIPARPVDQAFYIRWFFAAIQPQEMTADLECDRKINLMDNSFPNDTLFLIFRPSVQFSKFLTNWHWTWIVTELRKRLK